jgi:plasmid stability protein
MAATLAGRAERRIMLSLKAIQCRRMMAQLTVRNVNDQVVKALKKRAAEHGRSAEAEHREILRAALLEGGASFAERAAALRDRLRSSTDSADLIRAGHWKR